MEANNIQSKIKNKIFPPCIPILTAVVIIAFIVGICLEFPLFSVRNVFDEIDQTYYNDPYYTKNKFSIGRIKWLKHHSGGGGWLGGSEPYYEYWIANKENFSFDDYEIRLGENGYGVMFDKEKDGYLFYSVDFWLDESNEKEYSFLSCYWRYSIREKKLYQNASYYQRSTDEWKDSKDAMDEHGMTEEQLKEYQHYALYDMLIKSWCETNPSAFSVDDIGDITIIDGRRPK